MQNQPSIGLPELGEAEIVEVSGGMRLPPYDPSINVSYQGNVWDLRNSSGPLIGGYVLYKILRYPAQAS